MPISGTIEQALLNGYLYSDTVANDMIFRMITSNSFLFGFGSNRMSSVSVQDSGLYVNGASNSPTNITLYRGASNNTSLANNDIIGSLNFVARYSTSSSNPMGNISMIYTGNGTTKGGDMTFSTECNAGLTERLRITGAGNVGIGTIAPTCKLDVNGTIASYNSSSNAGSIKVTGGTGQANDTFWVGFGHGSNSSDVNDRARIGVNIATYGAGRLFFTTGGGNGQAERMRIDESGNVGIGSTTPAYKLDVVGTVRSTGNTITNNLLHGDVGYGSGWAGIQHSNVGANSYALIQSSSGQTVLNCSTGQAISFRINNSEQGTWNNTGLGINNLSPAYKLDVNGSIGCTGTMWSINSTMSNSTSFAPLIFGKNTLSNGNVGIMEFNYIGSVSPSNYIGLGFWGGNNKLVVQNSGNVGIGTTAPSFKLDVNGSTRLANNVGQGSVSQLKVENNTSNMSFFVNLTGGSYNNCVSGGDCAILAGTHQVDAGSLVLGNWGTSNAGIKISNNGNIGIGTPTPAYKLDVNGTINVNGSILMNTADNTYIGLNAVGASPILGIIKKSGYGPHFAFTSNNGASANSMAFSMLSGNDLNKVGNCNLINYMNLTNNGYLGIGNSAPSYPLDVINDTNSVIRVGTSGGGMGRLVFGNTNHGIGRGVNISTATDSNDVVVHTAGSGSVVLCANSGEGLRLNSSGYVGIGTASPSCKLDVTGVTKISDGNSGNTANFSAAYQLETRSSTGALQGWGKGSNFVAAMYAGTTSSGGWNAASSIFFVAKDTTNSRSINAAGTVNASGADYAEYMKKSSVDIVINKGDIAGVTSLNLLTTNFSESVSFFIKSTNPCIVGGDTWGSDEIIGKKPDELSSDATPSEITQYNQAFVTWEANYEAARNMVDRMAFSGQVPVNVTGTVEAGDYIVPVQGENDEIIPQVVKDSDITFAQFKKAVGKVLKVKSGTQVIVKVL